MTPLSATSHTGATVTFDGTFVTITRTGWMSRATVGKGTKRIPVASITAVQWKPASALMSGFIQFTLAGGVERRSKFGSQTTDAVNDENSVVFNRKRQTEFEALRSVIEAAMAAPATNSGAATDVVDQLRRLAELRDSGAVSAEEFAAFKAQLLDT